MAQELIAFAIAKNIPIVRCGGFLGGWLTLCVIAQRGGFMP
jgi:hypothetical protein